MTGPKAHLGGENSSAIDHEARGMARSGLDRLSSHEKFCEERHRRADKFEDDMRRSVSGLHQKIDDNEKSRFKQRIIEARAHSRIQTRQNVMWAALTFSLVFGLKYFIS